MFKVVQNSTSKFSSLLTINKNIFSLNSNENVFSFVANINFNSYLHTTNFNQVSDKNKVNRDNETEEFQKDLTSGIKNLESVGIAKRYWSWPQYNRVIYPPSDDGKPQKNPYVHHMRTFIKYSPKKLWYPAFLIRGMSIDEAIKQLSFHKLKGAAIIKETLLEAQEMAVKEHNIEFKSNLWISFSSVGTAGMVKGLRKHMAGRMGVVKYRYSHYFVRLEEGKPPANYHLYAETYEARAKEYIERLRQRSIHLSI